jgi:sigma-B regulation protein RsbU (phosphoserine phosphatase)
VTPIAPKDATDRASELRWTVVALAVAVGLLAANFLLPSANLSGALVVAPFLASGGARPARVAAVGGLAAAGAIGVALSDSSGLSESAVRMAVIVVGTLAAMRAATLRIRRQERLVDLSTVAEAAQRAILRKPAAKVGSVAVATWYQSSLRAATVGGDCYEILATPFGTRAIVGDVRGHGTPSVRLMALVVGAFRALASIQEDLTGVARELDLLTTRYASSTTDNGADGADGEEFVTAVLCQVNDLTMRVANCGHPPPLLVSPANRVIAMHASVPTFPLGLGSAPVVDTWVMGPGSRVLLYTDGLIEAVDRLGNFFDLHGAAKGLATGPLDHGIAELVRGLGAHTHGRVNDDVAIMLIEPHSATHEAG